MALRHNDRHLDQHPNAAASQAEVVTPHDTNNIENTRAVYVGGAGNLKILLVNDTDPVTLVGVVAGSVLPIRVKRVYSTDTTATNIVALR